MSKEEETINKIYSKLDKIESRLLSMHLRLENINNKQISSIVCHGKADYETPLWSAAYFAFISVFSVIVWEKLSSKR
jgi:hypothetical protein